MILEIILGVICVVFFFVMINLTKKVESLEDRTAFYEEYINAFGERVDSVQDKLKQIDNRGTFESDDEVGFFFTYVKELNNDINQLIGLTGEKDNEQSDNTINE